VITQWIPAGVQMASVDERGSITGRLIPLDEQIVDLCVNAPKIRVQEVEKHVPNR